MSDSNELVTILLPFRNTAPYLRECLDSIVNQTYTNWQLIAVNNQSNDGSNAIVHQYSEMDKRIELYQNTNHPGIIDALRLAWSHTKGKYVTRMDSDDIMTPDRLRLMVQKLQQSDEKTVVTGLVRYFSEDILGDGYSKYEQWLNRLTLSETNFNEIYKECVIPSPCWMTTTENLEATGHFEPEVYPEDYDLCFRFYKNGFQVAGVDEILLHWRDYGNRNSRTDPNYADQNYYELKLRYFFEIDHKKENTLVVWGAGKRAKELVKLIPDDIDIFWVCNNDKKIGRHIYAKQLHHFSDLKQLGNIQVLIPVAGEEDQQEIKSYLTSIGNVNESDIYFFN